MDQACSKSIVEEKLIHQFGVKLALKSDFTGTVFGKAKVLGAPITLEVSDNGKKWHTIPHAVTRRGIHLEGPELCWADYTSKCPLFQGVEVENVSYEEIQLVIEADVERLILPHEAADKWIQDENGVLAFRTPLGWSIGGPLSVFNPDAKVRRRCFSRSADSKNKAEPPKKPLKMLQNVQKSSKTNKKKKTKLPKEGPKQAQEARSKQQTSPAEAQSWKEEILEQGINIGRRACWSLLIFFLIVCAVFRK
jgi:hypothetical protein